LREYETTFIVQPEISDEGREALSLRGVLERSGAAPPGVTTWARRSSPTIKKFQKGYHLRFIRQQGRRGASSAPRLDESACASELRRGRRQRCAQGDGRSEDRDGPSAPSARPKSARPRGARAAGEKRDGFADEDEDDEVDATSAPGSTPDDDDDKRPRETTMRNVQVIREDVHRSAMPATSSTSPGCADFLIPQARRSRDRGASASWHQRRVIADRAPRVER
jgi:hypothetical protein